MNRTSGLAVVLMVVACGTVSGNSYKLYDVGGWVNATDVVNGRALNNAGQVVAYNKNTALQRTVVWREDQGIKWLYFNPSGSWSVSYCQGWDIDESGRVIGSQGSTKQGARWELNPANGRYEGMGLGIPSGYTKSNGRGMNDSGQAVGPLNDGTANGVLWTIDGTTVTSQVITGSTSSGLDDINDTGIIVGWSGGSTNHRPTVWEPEDSYSRRYLIYKYGEVFAINNANQAVGYRLDDAGVKNVAVLWERTAPASWTETFLPDLVAGIESYAYGINPAGTMIVGASNGKACLWMKQGGAWSAPIDLNTLSLTVGSGVFGTLTDARDVNDWGMICGTGTTPEGYTRGFALVPVLNMQGTVVLPGYLGDNATVAVKFDLTSTSGEANLSRTVLLNADGSFVLENIPPGTYDIAIRNYMSLTTVIEDVSTVTGSGDLGTIELKGADFNGDDQVTFEDFAILQNNYGQSGLVAAGPQTAHAVDGVLSAGEWANWYSDPIADNGTGDVDLVGWAAEVQNGILYAAFQLNPNGPTVAQYDDFQTPTFSTGHYLWAGLGIDVDPDTIPATGVAANNPFPVPLDICPELGMDQGGLVPTDPVVWNSLNLWGDGNDFAHYVPVTPVVAAYQGHVLEYAVPLSAITAEVANTDGAIAANVWKIGARLAAHGFGGGWVGDITDLQSVPVAGVHGRVTVQGYQGDPALVGVRFDFTPVGSGTAATERVILNSNGTFCLSDIAPGTYTVTVKSQGTLSAVLTNVSVTGNPVDLGGITLVNADANGDDEVSFGDFSILQNSYGDSGAAAAAPSAILTGGCGSLGLLLFAFLGLALGLLRPWNG